MAFPQREDLSEPVCPALLFEADGRMDVIHDLAVANELLDTADDVHEVFDGLGRPLRSTGPDGNVSFQLASDKPEEAKIRARVQNYYSTYASRHPGIPPQESDLAAFVFAVANDEVIE